MALFVALALLCLEQAEASLSMQNDSKTRGYDDLFLTTPVDQRQCKLPVLNETTIRSFLISRGREADIDVWTDARKYKVAEWLTADEQSTLPITDQECECGFLRAKGFDSGTHSSFGINLCNKQYGFVCRKQDCSDCNNACYNNNGGECFHINCFGSDWYAARRLCFSTGGHLAVINGTDLKVRIEVKAFDLCQRYQRKFWVGMSDCAWNYGEDGPFVPISSWMPEQPDGAGDCAVLSYTKNSSMGFKAQPCGSQHAVLCMGRNQSDAVRPDHVSRDNNSDPSLEVNSQGIFLLPVWTSLLQFLTLVLPTLLYA